MLEIDKFDKIIVANWKLNGSFDFIDEYFHSFQSNVSIKANVCGVICPPSLYLDKCSKYLNSLFLGSQDCSNYDFGAFTGEISASMLNDFSCKFCIVGHSERRQIFKETSNDILIKVNELIKNNINPIVCVGESLEQKNKGLTYEVLNSQIINSMPQNNYSKSIIIAYEPIWAIGTGLTPTLDEIDDIHLFLKKNIKNYENYKIIYGGSVKSDNARNIMQLDNVDGVLVGGSSLNPKEFIKILNS